MNGQPMDLGTLYSGQSVSERGQSHHLLPQCAVHSPAYGASAVVFQNPGLVDLAAVTTMGISVKEGDQPIGYFGTGLKFAIATILRDGGAITLFRGMDCHEFTTTTVTVRGQDFEQVCMDGTPLGFTTQLGRDWEPWMAFRELASNCRDEGGHYSHGTDWSPRLGHTTIAVRGLEQVYMDRRDILLEGDPVASFGSVDIHHGQGNYVFYRGVRIFTPSRPTVMRYNINAPIDLTEDRTARWTFQVHGQIEQAIQAMTDEGMLRRVLTCGESHLEHHLDLASDFDASPEFLRVVNQLAMGAECSLNANPSAVQSARRRSIAAMKPSDGMEMAQRESVMLEKATGMLRRGGFDISAFLLICADTLGPGIMGLAQDGKIFIARAAFDKGTRELAATLLEEFAHLRSGEGDCTRGFQNWLFDQILIKVEVAAGEPF